MLEKQLERRDTAMNEGLHRQRDSVDMTRDQPEGMAALTDDWQLVDLLRSGDEAAFETLIDRHHTAMLRIAMVYVMPRAVAEEVVQETWMAMLESLPRFEGRSSLKLLLAFRQLQSKKE